MLSSSFFSGEIVKLKFEATISESDFGSAPARAAQNVCRPMTAPRRLAMFSSSVAWLMGSPICNGGRLRSLGLFVETGLHARAEAAVVCDA